MKRIVILALVAMTLAATSCGTYKRLGYLQDMDPGVSYSMPQQPDARIAKGDKMAIIVACSTPDLALPFNILNGVSPIDPVTGDNSTTEGITATGMQPSNMPAGYEVDANGDINFPVLGKVHAEGLTLSELKTYLEAQIVEKRYIKDPVVVATFTNFKFTILGEGGVGVYSSPDGKVNMFDALAMSGDLTDDAVRNDIWVVRTVDGKRQLYTVDLKTKDCYYSPAFFIQQNDMIYVKPRNKKFDQTVNNRWTVLNSLVGVLGTALNGWIWLRYMMQ